VKNNFFQEKEKKIVFLMSIIFIFFTVIFSQVLYKNYHTIYEIGMLEQPIWNTVNGNFFYSVSGSGNLFGNHNHPILFFILPIYFFFPSTFTILILSNLTIVLGVIPIYKLAQKKLRSNKAGFVFALSYLLFPSFYYSNIRSFHPIMLVVPFLAYALYYLEKEDWKKLFIFLFLALITNETISLLVIMFGIYIFLKSNKKFGTLLVAFGVLWFLFSIKVVIPYFSQEQNYRFIGGLYGHLGSTPGEIIKTITTNPIYAISYGSLEAKILYLKVLFRHNLFIALLNPEILILTIPVFLQNLFSSSPYKYDYVAHYTYPLIPILFTATITGTKRILKLKLLKNFKPKKRLEIILILILISSVFSAIVYGLYPTLKENCYLFDSLYQQGKCPLTNDIIGNSPKENYPIIEEFVNQIPDDASVMAQNHVFAHVSNRNETYLFDYSYNCNYAEYILLDKSGPMTINFKNYINESTRKLGYEIIKQKKDVYLLKRLTKKKKCV